MPVIRVFRAEIFADKIEQFRDFFLNQAAALVQRQSGLISMRIGLPTPTSPREFLMITVWEDLSSLVGFTGESWQHARIEPGERDLIERAHVHHYEQAEAF